MNRSFQVVMMSSALLVGAGCQTKGPAPKEGATPVPGVATTETTGAHPGGTHSDPHAGMGVQNDPHAGIDMGQNPGMAAPPSTSPLPDESGMIDVGAIAFKMPGEWGVEKPKSSMRRAQLSAPGSAGPGELIVYFFGAQGAGSAEANVERWVGQFKKPDGSPVTDSVQSHSKVAGMDVVRVEVSGQFAGGMGPQGLPQPTEGDQRMIAAIVNSVGGPYYFKLLGPNATIAENGKVFDALIASVVPSP
ncbi:MAG: hypothetical protein ACN4G0_15670 [Polyangiales bacterium]